MRESGLVAGSVVPLFRPGSPKTGNNVTDSQVFCRFYVGETGDLIAVAGGRIRCPHEVLDVWGRYLKTGKHYDRFGKERGFTSQDLGLWGENMMNRSGREVGG